MEDMLIMSKKELQRKTLLEAYRHGKLTLNEVASRLQISYRQVKRVWRKYKSENDIGLCHKNRGKRSPNAYDELFKLKVINQYQAKYLGFGPTFAAEKLFEDDGILIHAETLRLWLKEAGLWHRQRKHNVYRERRERRPNFGDLLQIDGSIHQWFVGNETHYCLLNIVDDATGLTFALLDKGETTKILLTAFKKWIEKYGIPKAVYVDLKSVYVSPKRMKEKFDDDLLIHDGFSVFEQVCQGLNIEIIKAYSAQAKGRVERKHGLYQDRLVKDLKLYGINTIESANTYLEDTFLNKINSKYAIEPKDEIDFHRDPSMYDLEQIFCWRYKRQIRNDWTIQFKREYYQIEKGYEKWLKPGDFIVIKKYLDGTMRFWHENADLLYEKLEKKPVPPSKSKKYYQPIGYDRLLQARVARKNSLKSPWRKTNRLLFNKKAS